jgi:thioredoxin-related protein
VKINLKYSATFAAIIFVLAVAYFVADNSTPVPDNGSIQWKSFNDAAILAKQSNKKILVDVYTDWCTWCKKMDSEVYTNSDIVRQLNDNFVAVKLNAESDKSISYKGKSMSEAEFAQSLGVTGYPTTVFFDEESNPITNIPGFMISDNFAKVLKYIGQNYYKKATFQEYLSSSNP